MSTPTTTTVEVEIFGSAFNVRSTNDEAHLHKIAAFVDEKMKEIAAHTTAVDTSKIAILAALNIADQLFQHGGQGVDDLQDQIEQRVQNLSAQLEEVLEGSS